MGTQALGSQGGGGRRRSPVPCLFRQGSLYSLTLDEVQNHLGQPLHSMNLDDLLTKVLPWEDNFSMHRRTPNKKTVDEVWKDIQQTKKRGERQLTFGETTLEDFLESVGIVTEGGDVEWRNREGAGNVAPQALAQAPHWLQQYQQMLTIDQQQQRPMPCRPVPTPLRIGSPSVLDAVLQDGQMEMSAPLAGEVSDSVVPGRKRGHRKDLSEKTVERRQKRMIMNRESAARSRARKQAYTNELENKISRLEEENDRLRKRKELDTILHCAPPPEPNNHLRRSSSAPL